MADTMSSAEQAIELLHLEPHPTCCYVAQTYRSPERIAPGGLPAPFDGGRPIGTALYFLVDRQRHVQLHRIRGDQLYHRYLGDPLEVLALFPDGSHAVEVLGPDVAARHKLQLFLPGGPFHTARLVTGGTWFLGASTEWPGVEPADVEVGDPATLTATNASAALLIRDFT